MPNILRALKVPGFMSAGELTWLASRAAESRIIVEVGSWEGRSTRALADHVRPGGFVLAIDHWKGQLFDPDCPLNRLVREHGSDAVYARFTHNLRDLLDRNVVRPIRASSAEGLAQVAARLAKHGAKADMVFIDGDHQYDGCKADILAGRALLRPGGLLCGHDYNSIARHAGVKQSVNELYPQRKLVGSIWWVRV